MNNIYFYSNNVSVNVSENDYNIDRYHDVSQQLLLSNKSKGIDDSHSNSNIIHKSEEQNASNIENKSISDFTSKLSEIMNVMSYPDRNIDHFIDNINWIGYVENIKDGIIYGRMKEIEKNTTEEIVEFDIETEVANEDLPLLKVGAVFYYSIGHASIKGQKKKQDMLRFKRSIDFSEKDVDKISDKAKALVNSINWK